MKRERLERELYKIGWKIQKSWNGLNDKLISIDETIKTDIRVCDDHFEPYSNKLYGGKSFVILAKWYFANAYKLEDGSIAINHLIIMKIN